MHALRAKYGDVLAGKQRMEQEVHSLSQAREEDRKEINDLRRQQQETVIKGNGTSETLNQLYINTLRKYEAIKGRPLFKQSSQVGRNGFVSGLIQS